MTPFEHNRNPAFRAVLRDVLVLVLAEVVIVAFAWCLSTKGKAMLTRLFRKKYNTNGNNTNTANTIDV